MKKYLFMLSLCLMLVVCLNLNVFAEVNISDPNITQEAIDLYRKLKDLEGNYVMFGHQDAYCVGTNIEPNKFENIGKSDVLTVTGMQPGVVGFDIGFIEVYYTAYRDPEFAELIKGKDRRGNDYELGSNIDQIQWDHIREAIKYAHEIGSIITISWHSVNPLTGHEYGKNVTWEESVVKAVLPGGKLHERFNLYLDAVIEFNNTLVDSNGNKIPYLFRPFHEHSGDWFWWGIDDAENPNNGTAWSGDGGRLNDPEDFAELWRYTVNYLRDRGMNNVLYVYSPDRSRLKYEGTDPGYNETLATEYMEGYPGDDYVDIFGIDNYWDVGHYWNTVDSAVQYNRFVGALETVSVLAQKHGKMAAVSEMGLASEKVLTETGRSPNAPFTEWFLEAVKTNSNTQRILYGLCWRNRYRGENAEPWGDRAEDLVRFAEDPFTYFVNP